MMPFAATTALPVFSAPAAKSSAKTSVKAKVITRGEITLILTSADKATHKKDVNGIVAPMAANAVIRLSIHNYGEFNWNRAQYKAYAEQTLRMVENYQYKRSSTRITIAPNGQSARVTATVQETMQMNGIRVRGVTNEAVIFQIQGGRAVITSLTGVSRMTQSA